MVFEESSPLLFSVVLQRGLLRVASLHAWMSWPEAAPVAPQGLCIWMNVPTASSRSWNAHFFFTRFYVLLPQTLCYFRRMRRHEFDHFSSKRVQRKKEEEQNHRKSWELAAHVRREQPFPPKTETEGPSPQEYSLYVLCSSWGLEGERTRLFMTAVRSSYFVLWDLSSSCLCYTLFSGQLTMLFWECSAARNSATVLQTSSWEGKLKTEWQPSSRSLKTRKF